MSKIVESLPFLGGGRKATNALAQAGCRRRMHRRSPRASRHAQTCSQTRREELVAPRHHRAHAVPQATRAHFSAPLGTATKPSCHHRARDARGDLDRCTDGIRGGDDGRRLVAPDVLPIVHGEREAARSLGAIACACENGTMERAARPRVRKLLVLGFFPLFFLRQ